MSAQFLTIAQALVEQLKTANVARGNVSHIMPSQTADEWVTVEVRRGVPRPKVILGARLTWDTLIIVTCGAVFGVGSPQPQLPITTLVEATWAAVFNDSTLGGATDDIEEGPIVFDYAPDEDERRAEATITLTAMHQTENGVLS